jgi:hypoxanthine phosphoribosyltransferase
VKTYFEGLNIENKDVIVLEDIIDSGRTMKKIISDLKNYNPASICIASFLLKPEMLEEEIDVRYIGKEIPSEFVVGYGLDYAEQGRYLDSVYHHLESED